MTDNLVLLAEAGTVKYIEAEDFNYDGGSWMTFEEVGTGGAYDGLGAEMGVDLNNAGNNSPKYRVIDPHPGMTESMWDSGRNGFDMDVDFKMGWNGGGEWWNYTRDFAEEDNLLPCVWPVLIRWWRYRQQAIDRDERCDYGGSNA